MLVLGSPAQERRVVTEQEGLEGGAGGMQGRSSHPDLGVGRGSRIRGMEFVKTRVDRCTQT
jgi:hypothetical protein